MKKFPIIKSGGEYIPFEMMMEHEEQCFKNHCQSVETLANRGGTSYLETYYILNDSEFKAKPCSAQEYDRLSFNARRIVHALSYEWLMKNNKIGKE